MRVWSIDSRPEHEAEDVPIRLREEQQHSIRVLTMLLPVLLSSLARFDGQDG